MEKEKKKKKRQFHANITSHHITKIQAQAQDKHKTDRDLRASHFEIHSSYFYIYRK